MSDKFDNIMSSIRADDQIINGNLRGIMMGGSMERAQYGFGNSAKDYKEITKRIYSEWLRDFLLNRFVYRNAGEQFDGQMLESYLQSMQGVAGLSVNVAGQPIVIIGSPNGSNVNLKGEQTQFLINNQFSYPFMDKSLGTSELSHDGYLDVVTRLNPNEGDVVVITNRSNLFVNGTTAPVPRTNSDIIDYFADELADLKMLSRMNRKNMVTPIIGAVNNRNMAGQLNGILNSFDNYDRYAVYDSKLGNVANMLQTVNLNNGNIMPALRDEFNNIITEFLTMFGINSVGIDKKERLVKAEANANNQLIENSANIYMTSRKQAIDLFNYRFNQNISIEYNDYSESLREKFGADAKSEEGDINVEF